MKKITVPKEMNNKLENDPIAPIKPSKGYLENILTPVNRSGVLIPWMKILSDGRESEFKLICSGGLEYFIVTDSEWRAVLSQYSWEEVKVIGLLNLSNGTLIPQKVYPKGPTEEVDNVIDLAAWKARNLAKKIIRNVNDLVVIPAAVFAVLTY